MRKMLLFITAAALISVLAACNQNEDANGEKEKERITPVETAKAVEDDLVIEKSIYGRTGPASTTPVMVQTPGEITELEVTNGDIVEADDLIATIKTAAGEQQIYAPADGEVAKLNVSEGAMASNSEPLAVIADVRSMKLSFTVTSETQQLLSEENTFSTKINDETYQAEITSVSSMPDDTGLYPIKASIEEADGDILAGVVAVMNIPEKTVKNTIIVPTEAVMSESGESFVYTVENDTVSKINVTIEDTQSDKTAVKGDVNQGDRVVTSGQLTLEDGSKVDVVKAGNKS
ncbi:efflux RND transporter periplasmic adaptor subunit [Virgibacillus siamensis]|uniref:efflux RND transporter periplasmic adaptor subunit n=1 Tax=Virgibacillus siamensis TaxID=480071 RepID=UPI000985DE6F|nr:efflux RND transporter periplasmic adaptor subunit [Virgibacillus siamensis]